ncbi:AbiJ-NTD4 domain-containing protein [Rhizobium leguminosarum]|uniref:AbiJ-NTD4 domain-containing protein n=1 Tax=Rhizobium leguminosarum TaxID=384 RepID=UPI0010308C63|nr:hypothetical protein [Rhizobium leguminosarum]TAX99793.1 hypothetical protein ELH95_00940 [Rhizobium leguminosarum]
MITDVFSIRYEDTPIWSAFTERDRRFLVQAAKLVTEQLFPRTYSGDSENADASLKAVNDRVATEIGLIHLGQPWFQLSDQWHKRTIADQLSGFMMDTFQDAFSPDLFMKIRINVVELAFRIREEQVTALKESLPARKADLKTRFAKTSGGIATTVAQLNKLEAQTLSLSKMFEEAVIELNERMLRAHFPLSYHRGFIQISNDATVAAIVEKPFWALVSAPLWENVAIDMARAVDLRDNNRRDASLYASKALESTLKIISDKKGWTTGHEVGPVNYVNNLVSKNNGRFIEVWEQESLHKLFSDARSPFGHGPGTAPMPSMTPQQASWAIEVSMSWIKSLINRL